MDSNTSERVNIDGVIGLKVYVVGHKRPDTDSVVSAIAYAHLKNVLDKESEYIPARLGDLNPETRFVLNRFGIDPPELLKHVYIQVEDAMTSRVIKTTERSTIYEAGNLMVESGVRSIPVVNDSGVLVGLLTERRFAKVFLSEFNDFSLDRFPPRISDVLRILDGKLLSGEPESEMKGRIVIGAMSEEEMFRSIGDTDILVVVDREEIVENAIDRGVRCLVLTGGYVPNTRVLEKARRRGIHVLVSPHDTYTTVRLIKLSLPVGTIVKREPLKIGKDAVLREFAEDLMEDKDGVAVVVDDELRVVGIITRHDLINPRKKRVILVDHSEKSQTVDGIEEAEILEIVDHHRLGGLETGQPIVAHIKPVGSTCTVIWELYRSAGVVPPREIAGAMLAAVLSDTMILKSPTTTPEDERVVEHLSNLTDLDPIEFGLEMYRAKTEVESLSADEILSMDLKEFRFSRGRVAIAQIEVIDPDPILKRREEIFERMDEMLERGNYDLVILMVTDVMKEESHLMARGQVRILERALGEKLREGTVKIKGLVSRKKQLVPGIARVLQG